MKTNHIPPKETKNFFKKDLPTIYQWQFFEIALYHWVKAAMMSGSTLHNAIVEFREHYCLNEDNASIGNCKMIYYRKDEEMRRNMKDMVNISVTLNHMDSATGIMDMLDCMKKEIINEIRRSDKIQ